MKLAVIEAFDVAGLDNVHAVSGLEAAFDEKKTFLGDGEAKFFEELRRDDGVGDAGFVFEADENEAFGGAWALAANDVAGDANDLAVLALRKIDGAPDIFKMRAEKGHGVWANGERETGVIGSKALEVGHVGERRGAIVEDKIGRRSWRIAIKFDEEIVFGR